MQKLSRASTAAIVAAFLFMAASYIAVSSAQASVPGPADDHDCLTKLLNMSDCLSYVTEGTNVTVPDKACCPELAGLVDSSPLCLCQLLGKSEAYGIKIDVDRALKLPSVCHVTTPVDLCSAVGVPIGSPSPTQGPISPGVQPPAGLAPGPSTGNNDSAASGNAGSVPAILVGLAFAFLL